MAKIDIYGGPTIISRGEEEKIKTPTEKAKRLLKTVFNSVAQNPDPKPGYGIFSDKDLSRLFDRGYWITLFGDVNEQQRNTERINDEKIIGAMSYLLSRFLNRRDFRLLLEKQLHIHFSDDPDEFYNRGFLGDDSPQFRRPDKRGRVYRIDKIRIIRNDSSEEEETHITFLIRRSVEDNTTDGLEILSFLAFLGFAKELIQQRINTGNNRKLESFLENFFGKENYYNFFRNELIFSRDSWSLQPLGEEVKNRRIQTDKGISETLSLVYADFYEKIKYEFERRMLGPFPEHVIIGNDFSLSLLVAMGGLVEDEVEKVYQYYRSKNNGTELYTLPENIRNSFIKKGDTDEIIQAKIETLRRYAALMYLNRLNIDEIDDPKIKNIKSRIDSLINGFRTRVTTDTYTCLGDPVDILDFTKIPDEVIDKIPYLRELIRNLKIRGLRVLQLPYPLGDSIYGLIKALYLLGMRNLGFFGKVGATIKSGQKITRGRVVYPEYVLRMGRNISEAVEFKSFNRIVPEKDCAFIDMPDIKEILLSNNSLLLQTPHELGNLRLKDGTEVLPLLDMEAWWMVMVCQELSIPFYALYYISDNTILGKDKTDQAITKSLGEKGVLASLETATAILNRWAKDLDNN